MDLPSEPAAGVAFDRFLALPLRRELLADGKPVKLGRRAFDVLLALIEARGSVVSKNALKARVWSGRIIEENSLEAQISALRAAFEAECGLIRTVSGRGYQFIGDIRGAPVSLGEPQGAAAAQLTAGPPPTNIPEPKYLDVHLIADNYATHKHAKVRAWLKRHPRFHMHFTPTPASWINQVERFFGLTEDRIRCGVFKSVAELEAAISDVQTVRTSGRPHPTPFESGLTPRFGLGMFRCRLRFRPRAI
jgi:DNA-binding winged helix-turn-helix (wHTH) protein